MTIIIVICAATVYMVVSLPACGGHGKREMVLKRTRWVEKPKSRQRAKHGPQMNRRHPVSAIPCDSQNGSQTPGACEPHPVENRLAAKPQPRANLTRPLRPRA